MSQRRKLPAHTSSIDLMRKKLLQKFAHIIPPRRQQRSLMLLEKLGELQDVSRVSADRKPRQPFLDPQIIKKPRKREFASASIRNRNVV